MKLFIRILLGLLALVVLVLLIAVFVKKDYAVYREIVINKPKQEVFDYIRMMKNQDYYSKWVMRDPEMKKDFKGNDGTAGFIYAWEGEKAGKGEQEILKIDGDSINVELRFKKPMENVAQMVYKAEAAGENQTKVTWGISGTSAYPMNFMNLFSDNLFGKDMESSLKMLKDQLEKQ